MTACDWSKRSDRYFDLIRKSDIQYIPIYWNDIERKRLHWTAELKSHVNRNDSNLVNMQSQQPWQIILRVRLASHINWLTDARYEHSRNCKACLDKYTQEVACMVSKRVSGFITVRIRICVSVSPRALPLWARDQQYRPSWPSPHKSGGEIRWGHALLLALAACSRK